MIYLLMLVFAACEGITHAILWSKRGADAYKWNEHIIFVVQRIILGLLIWYSPNLSLLIAGAIAYIPVHASVYYEARKRIDGAYPKGWVSEPSDGSTARFNFSFFARVLLFSISLAIITWRAAHYSVFPC